MPERGSLGSYWSRQDEPPRFYLNWLGLTALRRRDRHHRTDLREDRTNAGRDSRHYGPSGYRDKARHQRVFNQVLTASIAESL